jgi:hypothetical protein
MELMLLRLFQKQVLFQCKSILISANGIDESIKQQDVTITFYHLQNLLNATANVSKALWGQGGKFSSKRKALRVSIGVKDTSPLKITTMRNNFEHFDERLDKWWQKSKQHNNLDFSIMPKSGVKGLNPIDWFRVFDPTSKNLYFWSQEFNIGELVSEVREILPKLQQEAEKPHWEVEN